MAAPSWPFAGRSAAVWLLASAVDEYASAGTAASGLKASAMGLIPVQRLRPPFLSEPSELQPGPQQLCLSTPCSPKVACQVVCYISLARLALGGPLQRIHGHHKARRAEAALAAIGICQHALDGMQP